MKISPSPIFIIINKPSGISSYDVLRNLKKRFDISRMGYLGTLDPLATGVLAVFIGKGTKLIPYFDDSEKSYIVDAELGKRSDSYDNTGKIELVENISLPNKEAFSKAVASFLGDQQQIQPAFSALNFEGKRAYEHAREGRQIDLGSRQVTFHRLEILSDDLPQLRIDLDCSSGTYVRSFIHELGEKLKTGALMSNLHRTKAGPFDISDAVSLDEASLETTLSLTEFLEKYADSNPSLKRDKGYLLRKLQA